LTFGLNCTLFTLVYKTLIIELYDEYLLHRFISIITIKNKLLYNDNKLDPACDFALKKIISKT